MYINDGVSISKASDGTFLISCRVKKKMEKKKGEKSDMKDMPAMTYPESEDKTLTAGTEDEAIEKIREMLPMLENGLLPEEEFKKAFAEATE